MSPGPFTRRQKNKAEEEAYRNATTEGEQALSPDLFTANPSVTSDPSDQVTVSQVQAGRSQGQAPAGWYPDATEPESMRYWDGFHWTGQAVRTAPASPLVSEPAVSALPAKVTADDRLLSPASDVTNPQGATRPPVDRSVDESLAMAGRDECGAAPPPPASARVGSAPGTRPSAIDGPDNPSPEAPVNGPAETALRGVSEANTEAKADGRSAKLGVADHDDGESRGAPGIKLGPPVPFRSLEEAHETNNWAEETERAVARARAVGTPAAWEEAAQAAVVVSEMARTMQAAADAKQTAEQMAKAAQEAADAAKGATKAAAEAKQTAEQMAKAAQEAADAAKVAAKAAADAKQTAEQAAQAIPQSAEAAKVAVQAADSAKDKAQSLEVIVKNARAANTPAAWSEAAQLAAVAMERDETSSLTHESRSIDVLA
jgi:hypothetical protein